MLTKYDFHLLTYIEKHPLANDDDIAAYFGRGYAARLNALLNDNAVAYGRDASGCYTGGYIISDKGYMYMQDYSYNVAFSMKRLWEERYFKLAPIIISLIALIVAVISLLQELQLLHLEKLGML